MQPVPRGLSTPAAGDKRRSHRKQQSQPEYGVSHQSKKCAASATPSEPVSESCAAGDDRSLQDVGSGPSGSDTLAERAEDLRHVSDTAPSCAMPHQAAPLRPIVVLHLPARALTANVQFAAGTIDMPYNMPEALQALARRVRSFPEGDFESSPPPHLLDELNDGLLVVASNAVAAVAADAIPRVAGRARYRLLAWTVANARGATRRLTKSEAIRLASGSRHRHSACARPYHVQGCVRVYGLGGGP